MASSQVDIAPSSPFGFSLRFHNRRDRWRGRDRHANPFGKNFKDFVHSSSGQSRNASSISNESSHDHFADLWVHIPSHTINRDDRTKNHTREYSARATDTVFSGDAKSENYCSSAPVTPFQRENSPDQSESSVEIPNLGAVSSLVRKWRDFEAEAKSCSMGTSCNSPVCISRTNSVLDSVENASTEIAQKCSDSGDRESVVGGHETQSINEDSSGDCASSDSPSSQDRDSETTETERVRVADIIRKLTSSNEENNNDREHGVGNELSPFSPVLGSPRLRGRQAFRDLLMQAEHERHKELEGLVQRKAVSRFSQRGCIQAMLRVQLLRGAAEVKDGQSSNCTLKVSSQLTQSAILNIRERFKTGSDHVAVNNRNSHKEVVAKTPKLGKPSMSIQEEIIESMGPREEVVDDIRHSETSSSESPTFKVDSYQETKTPAEQCSFQTRSSEDERDGNNQHLTRTTGNRAIHNADPKGDEQLSDTSYNRSNCAHLEGDSEEGANNYYLSESDVSHTQVGWEELDSDYEQREESNEDWIADISRPRSEWECLRQERYEEMLDRFQEKEEIRQLLQRRSVSSFLSSDIRERIDRLMICRTREQPDRISNQTEEEDEEQLAREEEEERAPGDEARKEDFEEDESQIEQEYNESEDYSDETTTSLPSTTWIHNHSPDVSDDSDQLTSPSLRESSSTNSYSPESRQCSSFTNHSSSIEMELIYEMRGHMAQLHQEISELRKSIKSCTNMQRKLQRSVKQDVAAARKGRHSAHKKGQSDRNCCICHETQVDSLLYRCGHMCTCFKCAQELQWNSGRCPICRAAIIDVVRASYAH